MNPGRCAAQQPARGRVVYYEYGKSRRLYVFIQNEEKQNRFRPTRAHSTSSFWRAARTLNILVVSGVMFSDRVFGVRAGGATNASLLGGAGCVSGLRGDQVRHRDTQLRAPSLGTRVCATHAECEREYASIYGGATTYARSLSPRTRSKTRSFGLRRQTVQALDILSW